MDPIVFGVLTGLSGLSLFVVWSKARGEKRREARLESVAEIAVALGLADVTMEGADLEGSHGGLRVRVEASPGRLVVRGLARGLSLQRDGLVARVEQARGDLPVETGDGPFDQAVYVRGEPIVARALLDADTRALALAAIGGGSLGRDAIVGFAGGLLVAELRGEWSEDTPQRVEGARGLVALAHRLEEPAGEEERLSQVARTDPVARVRELALQTLVAEAPGHAATERALRRACDDPDPAIRLRAALLSGGKTARRTLQALSARVDVPDEVSAAAVEELGVRLSSDVLRGILAGSPRGRPKTDLAVVHALAKGGSGVAPALIAAFPRLDAAAAAAAAEVLAATGSPEAEDALIAAAARSEAAVRVAVAHALGAVGTARAVPVLHELEADGGPVLRAAREAVVAIQSRLDGVASGQLSLAESEGGQVALADGDGRVSLDRRGG